MPFRNAALLLFTKLPRARMTARAAAPIVVNLAAANHAPAGPADIRIIAAALIGRSAQQVAARKRRIDAAIKALKPLWVALQLPDPTGQSAPVDRAIEAAEQSIPHRAFGIFGAVKQTFRHGNRITFVFKANGGRQ